MPGGGSADMRSLITFFEGQVAGWTNLVRESNEAVREAARAEEAVRGELAELRGSIKSLEDTVKLERSAREKLEAQLRALQTSAAGEQQKLETLKATAEKAGSPEAQAQLLRSRADYVKTIVGVLVGAVVTLAVVFGWARYNPDGVSVPRLPAPFAPAKPVPPKAMPPTP